jgi:Zn-finger nucleic acid-binding protein
MAKAPTDTVLLCPRDKGILVKKVVGEATIEVCAKCSGQLFDTGEMFAACGIKADPSYWDRPETGGTVTESALACPSCAVKLLAQQVKYDDRQVEIDRCGRCGRIWLDKGEVDTIMEISDKLQPVLDAEKAKAQAELAAMGDVGFGSPGLIGRFLRLFKKG